MNGNAQTERNNSQTTHSNGFPDLRCIYRSWELATSRVGDPRLNDADTIEAGAIARDCERMACKITAMSLDDLAIKAVLVLGDGDPSSCAIDLGQTLVTDARRILAIPERDQEIADYFDIWAKLHKAQESNDIDDAASDQLQVIVTEVEAKVARLSPSTAEGLARKIIMCIDLGTRKRSIVKSARSDIERLAGHPLTDF